MQDDKKKVLLVEDHPIFRKGLAQIINSENALSVCAEAEDYDGGMAAVIEHKPHIAIVDLSLKNSSGFDLIKDIRQKFPLIPVLALSMHDENIYAERVLRAGAMGYLMKQEAPEIILKAVYTVLDKKVFVSESISSRILMKVIDGKAGESSAGVDKLSDRELEVFLLIGGGLGTRDIAEKIQVSIKTVENHKAHIKEKLGLKNSIELIQQATIWAKSK